MIWEILKHNLALEHIIILAVIHISIGILIHEEMCINKQGNSPIEESCHLLNTLLITYIITCIL